MRAEEKKRIHDSKVRADTIDDAELYVEWNIQRNRMTVRTDTILKERKIK